MASVGCLTDPQIEGIARVLGDCGTGGEISRALESRGLPDNSGESTKWRRLDWVFRDLQRQDKCANRVLDFMRSFLTLTRFVGQKDIFHEHLRTLNEYLAFSGVELLPNGDLAQGAAAREYRARLTADVVTGKLDVREAAAGLAKLDPLAAEEGQDDDSNRYRGSEASGDAEEGGPLPDVVEAERSEPAADELMAEGR